MTKKRNTTGRIASATTIVSVVLMCLSLLLLTGANFFVHDDNNTTVKSISMNADNDDNETPNPVEEHSKSNQGPTIQEEYLHEKHSFKDFAWLTMMLHHRILEAEKLKIVHYELISPPPKLS